MRGIYSNGITWKAGHVNLRPGRFCHLDEATGVVNYAYLEDHVNCISIGDIALLVGDPVTVKMIPLIDTSVWLEVVDTGARGANVYLDIQASQGAATGLGQFTAGTSQLPICVSDEVSAGSPSASVPNTIPVYQTNEVNNFESFVVSAKNVHYNKLTTSADLEGADLNGLAIIDADATAGDITSVLPALADVIGTHTTIHVISANDLILDPDGTETINGGTGGAAVTLVAGIYFLTKSATDWKLTGQ